MRTRTRSRTRKCRLGQEDEVTTAEVRGWVPGAPAPGTQQFHQIFFQQPKANCPDYPVIIGSKLFPIDHPSINFGKYSKVTLVTSSTLANKFKTEFKRGFPIAANIIEIQDGETGKSLEQLEKLWKFFLELKLDRKSLVINFGGGSVMDLGGFAAAAYMRGIDFLNVPSTLLGQIDAGLGGKVGVNFLGLKNIIGAFAPPIGVINDVSFLQYLDRAEIRSGLAEAVKHGAIWDRGYFDELNALPSLPKDEEALIKLVAGSVRIKAAVVAQDPFEAGLRKILNFGHTIGHALEAFAAENSTPLRHGEAISIGMAIEAKLSVLSGLLAAEEAAILVQTLNKFELPTRLPIEVTVETLLKYMLQDKKNSQGEIHWTLLESIGRAKPDCILDIAVIRQGCQ